MYIIWVLMFRGVDQRRYWPSGLAPWRSEELAKSHAKELNQSQSGLIYKAVAFERLK